MCPCAQKLFHLYGSFLHSNVSKTDNREDFYRIQELERKIKDGTIPAYKLKERAFTINPKKKQKRKEITLKKLT